MYLFLKSEDGPSVYLTEANVVDVVKELLIDSFIHLFIHSFYSLNKKLTNTTSDKNS